MRRSAVLAVFVLLFFPSLVLADFYRWVDKDGNEFFTNDRKQIPQEYHDDAVAVKPGDGRVSIAGKPGAKVQPGVAAAEHKDKYGRGEEYWRRKAANLRLKLRKQQTEYAVVVNQLSEQEKSKKSAKNRKKTRSSLEKKKIKLETEIAQSRRLLDVDLPDEARRAEAYPGWVRE